jgi:hypothetical protein
LKPQTMLSPSMTQSEFDNGYWYATEIKEFAKTIGIPSANRLRKDELEKAIKVFLKAGEIESPTKRSLSTSGTKDVEQGLSLSLSVARYTNDKETKDFLEREAQKLVPGLKRKSGTRYRFNRWREEQLTNGVKITYGDLVKEYVRLNLTKEPFAQIPIDCYINFMSDFLAGERCQAEAGAARLEEAEEARRTQELSFVGEVQLVETEVTFDTHASVDRSHTGDVPAGNRITPKKRRSVSRIVNPVGRAVGMTEIWQAEDDVGPPVSFSFARRR